MRVRRRIHVSQALQRRFFRHGTEQDSRYFLLQRARRKSILAQRFIGRVGAESLHHTDIALRPRAPDAFPSFLRFGFNLPQDNVSLTKETLS